jgi:hemoglobin/transferrin/lactoferrin receptor protein
VYNGDISITKVLGSFAKVDVTGFYAYLDNALVRRDFTLNGQDSLVYDGELSQIQALQNAALTEVYGLQAGLEVMFGAGFSLLSKYNFQIGEEELDNGTTSPSRHAAPWFGVTRLNYKRGKVNLQFYALYSGGKTFEQLPFEEQGKAYLYARDENGNPYSPAWYTLNFKAMYKINENFTVNAGVENIADKRYKTYSSGIVSPGRNVIISLKAQF